MRHLERDDEIYFRDRDGPRRGRVLCHGKHGATVECDGQRYRVKWDHVLGHHRRVKTEHRLIEQGEDGAILEDQQGRRRYLHGYGSDDADEEEETVPERDRAGTPGRRTGERADRDKDEDDKPERVLKALFPRAYGLSDAESDRAGTPGRRTGERADRDEPLLRGGPLKALPPVLVRIDLGGLAKPWRPPRARVVLKR